MAFLVVFPPPPSEGISSEEQYWRFVFDNQYSYSENLQAVEYLADEIMQDPDSRFKYSRVAIIEKRPKPDALGRFCHFSGKELKDFGLLKLWRINYNTGEWLLDTSNTTKA